MKPEILMPEILMIAPMMPSVMQACEAAYVVHKLWEVPNKQEFIKSLAGNIRAIATNGSVGASAELIDALPNLELVACYGVGVDAIALPRLKSRNIALTTTPDVLTADVADMAVALMLAVSRRIVRGDKYVRNLEWPTKGEMPLTRRVSGKRVGIVGLGRVGQALAKRLLAFDMQVSYFGLAAKTNLPYTFVDNLEILARNVDFLVVTAAGGAATKKLIDQTVLHALGPNGILINVSRGSVVDEVALLTALQTGALSGAGLDVFATEPNVPAAFFEMDNIVLMPHHASGTTESRTAMGELVVQNLAAHFSGQALPTPFLF